MVQDAFLNIWESRKSLDPDKNIKALLYQDVRNKAINYLNHQNVVEKYTQQIDWVETEPATQHHNFDEKDLFTTAAKKAIERLPDNVRQIYKLSRKDGLTYQEISEVLDISPKTVESKMSSALKKLRQDLSKYLQKRFDSYKKTN